MSYWNKKKEYTPPKGIPPEHVDNVDPEPEPTPQHNYYDRGYDDYGDESVPSSSWMEVVDQDDYLDLLYHMLRCERKDPTTGQWIQQQKPKVNERGIADLMTLYATVLNKNAILNDLRTPEIKVLLMQINRQTIFLLRNFYIEYDIDKRHLTDVLNMVDTVAQLALMRSAKARTLKFLQGTQKWQDSTSHHYAMGEQSRNKKGWW